MANPEHIEQLKSGVSHWNAWRAKNPSIFPDLSGISVANTKLSGIDLSDANVRNVNFRQSNLSEANLCGANLSDANLEGANLSGAKLINADLCRIKLTGANLQGANLKKTNIVEAHFDRVDLTRAILKESHLFVTDFSDAIFRDADLSETNFFEADLRRTDFRGAQLWGVEFYESNLTDSNLTNANLWKGRISRCDMTDARVDNTVVKELKIDELKGHPKPPAILRLDENGEKVIMGKDIASVFRRSDILEVNLNIRLTELELGCYQLYLSCLHKHGIVGDVHLSGQRYEGPKSVLCFQAASYDDIYTALPELLAPFPRSFAIDWKQTFDALSDQDRWKGMALLAKQEHKMTKCSRDYAERLAKVFMNFRNVFIASIRHAGNAPHVHYEIVNDMETINRAVQLKPVDPDSRLFLLVSLDGSYDSCIINQGEFERISREGLKAAPPVDEPCELHSL